MAAAYSAYQYTHTFTAPPDMALLQLHQEKKETVKAPKPLVLSQEKTTKIGQEGVFDRSHLW